MNYWSDERQRNRENWPRPFGLRRKSGHTAFSPSAVGRHNCRARLVWPDFRRVAHPSVLFARIAKNPACPIHTAFFAVWVGNHKIPHYLPRQRHQPRLHNQPVLRQ